MFKNVVGFLGAKSWLVRGSSPVVGSVDSPIAVAAGKRPRGDSPEDEVIAPAKRPRQETLVQRGSKRSADEQGTEIAPSPSLLRPANRPRWDMSLTPRSPYTYSSPRTGNIAADISSLPGWHFKAPEPRRVSAAASERKSTPGSHGLITPSQRRRIRGGVGSSRLGMSPYGTRPSLLPLSLQKIDSLPEFERLPGLPKEEPLATVEPTSVSAPKAEGIAAAIAEASRVDKIVPKEEGGGGQQPRPGPSVSAVPSFNFTSGTIKAEENFTFGELKNEQPSFSFATNQATAAFTGGEGGFTAGQSTSSHQNSGSSRRTFRRRPRR